MAHKLAALQSSTLKKAEEIRDAETKSILKIAVKIEYSEHFASRR